MLWVRGGRNPEASMRHLRAPGSWKVNIFHLCSFHPPPLSLLLGGILRQEDQPLEWSLQRLQPLFPSSSFSVWALPRSYTQCPGIFRDSSATSKVLTRTWFTYIWIPGGGHGNPLQYSCLENPMDRGAWRATVHGVAKSQTWLKWLSSHAWMLNIRRYMPIISILF